jgi:hypothetical protein
VHRYGRPADTDALRAIAERHVTPARPCRTPSGSRTRRWLPTGPHITEVRQDEGVAAITAALAPSAASAPRL